MTALIPCPGCGGTAACSLCHGDGKISQEYAAEVAANPIVRRALVERDQWRDFGLVVMAAVFGGDPMTPNERAHQRGMFGVVPPTEITEAIQAAQPGSDLAETVRSALAGRAWRAVTRTGAAACDYPLCRRRDEQGRILQRVALRPDGVVSAALTVHKASGVPLDDECHAWALWVRARLVSGAIRLTP